MHMKDGHAARGTYSLDINGHAAWAVMGHAAWTWPNYELTELRGHCTVHNTSRA